MLPLPLHPEADAEAIEAATYIKADDPVQGTLFVQALESAITAARTQPELYPQFDGEFRRLRTGKFRYAVVYRVSSETLQIIAVMHLHRKPGYWKLRSFS